MQWRSQKFNDIQPDTQEALDYAQSVFPQLRGISRSRIAFSINVRIGQNLRSVRIASMAWRRVMASLATYEIVDITILPSTLSSQSESALADESTSKCMLDDIPPPKYNGEASSSSPSLLGPDLYSSGVFLGCEKSPSFELSRPLQTKRRGGVFFGWLLRRP